MAYKEVTTINASKGIGEVINYINEVTNYWLSTGIMISIWIFIFMGYIGVKREDYFGGFAVSSYVVAILSLIGFLFNFVSGYVLTVAIGMSLMSVAFLLGDKNATA